MPPTGKFQENVLHDVFGFSGIANNPESNAEDKAVVAVEQDGQSVVATALKLGHQLCIVEPLQLGESWRLNSTRKWGTGGREFRFSQRTVPMALSRGGRDSPERLIYMQKCLKRQLLELLLYRRRAKDQIWYGANQKAIAPQNLSVYNSADFESP